MKMNINKNKSTSIHAACLKNNNKKSINNFYKNLNTNLVYIDGYNILITNLRLKLKKQDNLNDLKGNSQCFYYLNRIIQQIENELRIESAKEII